MGRERLGLLITARLLLPQPWQVATYDQFKQMYKGLGLTGTFLNVCAAAMSSGLLYSVVTMPLETAKNRMAFQRPTADGVLPFRTTLQTLRTVAGTEGTAALWRGFLPYYLRCGGHTVATFVAVAYLRDMYWHPPHVGEDIELDILFGPH